MEVPDGASSPGRSTSSADPKIQLEQAIAEAQEQHRRLKEQATNVIASQKQAEIRLNGKMAELEKLNANARQALIMAADAEKTGNADKAAQYTSAAETIANQLIQVEKDVESLKTMVLDSTQAVRSGQGRGAAEQPPPAGEDRREVEAAVSQLEQAKMQEEMNKAMAQLNETVGDDVPTLNEVRGEDRGPLRQGQGGVRAQRDVGRVAGARGRAGHRQRRGAEPPRRSCAPSSASTAARRPRRRSRASARHATGRGWRPAGLTGSADPSARLRVRPSGGDVRPAAARGRRGG